MTKNRWYAVLYMFAVTALFSAVVIGFARYTDDLVEANKQIAFERSVLSVFPDLLKRDMSNPEIHQLYSKVIEQPGKDSGGAYVARRDGEILGYAIPVEGQGFWAPIKGVVGVDDDKETITGIAFHEQNETPGLGAEITKPEFKDQFEGKVIASQGKPINFKRPGEPLDDSDVHAVTGATQTSIRVERIVNDAIETWNDKMSGVGGQK